MKHILFIVNGYPTKQDPVYAFIRPIVCEVADKGIKCTVIAPQSYTKILFGKGHCRKEHWIDVTEKGSKIDIIQPFFLSLSKKTIGDYHISSEMATKSIKHAINKYSIQPDLIYAHFWDCGIMAAKAIQGNVPVVVASGESRIRVKEGFSTNDIAKWRDSINGVICVSQKNLRESKELGLISEESEVIVLPNGVNKDEFYMIDKCKARSNLGFNDDDTIAIFVGAFSERKGVLRLVEAAKSIPSLKLILIGSGPQEPVSSQIIFKGRVPHDEIVRYLNAADMFVLPTQAEGCCNAIVEALSCGLPVISSDLDFNKDICNSTNSILVNPMDINEIANAMKAIKENPSVAKELSDGAIKESEKLQISNRIDRMIDFFELVCQKRTRKGI